LPLGFFSVAALLLFIYWLLVPGGVM